MSTCFGMMPIGWLHGRCNGRHRATEAPAKVGERSPRPPEAQMPGAYEAWQTTDRWRKENMHVYSRADRAGNRCRGRPSDRYEPSDPRSSRITVSGTLRGEN